MESGYRARIIKFFTFLGGAYFFLYFFLPKKIYDFEFGKFHIEISKGYQTIGVMAVGIGLMKLLSVHGSRIIFRRKGAFNSSALLVGLITMLCLAVSDWVAGLDVSRKSAAISDLADFARIIRSDYEAKRADRKPLLVRTDLLVAAVEEQLGAIDGELESSADTPQQVQIREEGLAALAAVRAKSSTLRAEIGRGQEQFNLELLSDYSTALTALSQMRQRMLLTLLNQSTLKRSYNLLFEGLFNALGAAMFSLLGFYLVSAAYRAFRVRSVESGLMMATAVVVMLGQIPFGLYISESMPEIRLWFMQIPNAASLRAITFGAAIAGLIMAVRMWLSIESRSFSKNQKGEAK